MDTVKNTIIKYLIVIFSMFVVFNVQAKNDITLTFTDSGINETVSGSGYNINGTSLEITKAGTYIIKGKCDDGNISVKKGVTGVTLVLDNLSLTSSTTAPIVVKKDGANVTIKLVGNNILTDNENPENEYSSNPDIADLYEGAAIKVKSGSSLTINGTGTLNVFGNAENGIKGAQEASITMNTGILNINAVNNGLACDGTITINNGLLSIVAENEGIKLSPNVDDTVSLAKLTVNGGKIVVKSGQDGIQAEGDILVNGWSIIDVDSLEDAIQTRSNFIMNNGIINIHTFEGYDTLNFDSDTLSAKGIKAASSEEDVEGATNNIVINGGTITIDSSDDAIHSDGYITITRGTINIKSGDDGIHADTRLVLGTQNGLERDPEIYVDESIEGLEAGNVYIYSGKIKVNALDDGINAAGGASSGSKKEHGEHFNPDTGQMEDNYALYVYGGSLYVNCEGDGLDANGSIYLYGGTQIIYHQDAQGNNSALDRDHRLVIDGATVFSAGGVADNGHVDDIGSNQVIIIDEYDFPANAKVAVYHGDDVVFNDRITKRSTYTFYTSPTLQSGSTINTIDELVDTANNPWNHHFDDGVITTPATPSTPGVITYTCEHSPYLTERKTYFYRDTVEFSIINKTNGNASVTIGNTTSTSDFVTSDLADKIYITSDERVEFIVTPDGVNFDAISPTEVNNNEYMYLVNPSISLTFYVIYDGDVNMDATHSYADAGLIAYSLVSTTNPIYRELSPIEEILADVNNDGLINTHDGLVILKELTGNDVYDESYFDITAIDPVVLDGIHDGEATVSFLTKKDVFIDAMDGRYSPSEEVPSANGYLQLIDIQGTQGGVEYSLVDVKNGFAGAVDTNGMNIPADTILVTLKYRVDKNTPTGTYPVKLRIDSVTAHNSKKDASFELTADVIVKGTTDPTTAFFTKDEGVNSIDVYYTQNYNCADGTNVTSVPVTDPYTGEIIPVDGEGQVNFKVNLKEGYIVSNIVVTPTEKYHQLKNPSETEQANIYRITQVTGDLEVQIFTKQASEYTASFIKGEHVSSIDVYYTKDYTNPDETDISSTFVRNGDNGEIDISGDGQVNFKVNVEPGYKVKDVIVSGNYKNIKEQDNRIYRITKVSGDIIISVTAAERENVIPTVSGYENSYVYTGKKIKPNFDVKITKNEQEITLVKDTDYTVTYGSNTNVGTNAGSITITSMDSSDYMFDPIVVNFDIIPYTLTMNNIDAVDSVVYTGSPLTPEVIVEANNKTLTEGTDYDIEFTNQDGNVGEKIIAKVTGKGNFTGVLDNIEINITDKYNQVISFDKDEITKVYGDDYTMTATITEGDGTIRYTSNNTQVATVDENTGAVTLRGTGTATIRAFASETDTYAEAVTSYKLIVKKAEISIGSVTVSNKPYDGTTTATVTDVVFTGLVKNENLVRDVDYTVEANFIDEEQGNNKEVTVVVDLSTEVIKRYSLKVNTYNTTASITAGIIKEENVILSEDTYTYDGSAKKPDVTVQIGNIILLKDIDYTIEYQNNINAGTATVVVKGINNYSTSAAINKTFTINKKLLTPTISPIADVIYNGGEQRPTLTVDFGGYNLELNKDYKVKYINNSEVGTATAQIIEVSTGNYTFDDNAKVDFNIIPYEIKAEDITLSYYKVKYDGEEKKPTVTVVANGIELIQDLHYSVTYADNVDIRNDAKVIVKGISNEYTGEVTVNFEITDKNVLAISGQANNQTIAYTGNAVQLQGDIIVAENAGNITASNLTIKWYNSNNEEIEQPINVGKYYVVYSYDDASYTGEYKVNFEITKQESIIPSINKLSGEAGNSLSSIDLGINGLTWKNPNTVISAGNNTYTAIYTTNNDTNNYTTKEVEITVYGKIKVNINTSITTSGGIIDESLTNVLEGTTKTIGVKAHPGYEINKVTVDGKVVKVNNNAITVTASTKDINIEASFSPVVFKVSIVSPRANAQPSGEIEVDKNSNKTINLDVEHGYKLTSVRVNGVEHIDDVVDNTITLLNIVEDNNIEITTEKITYEFISGARQTYTINENSSASFKINAKYDLFKNGGKLLVNGQEIDAMNYEISGDYTTIVFNKRYMDSLDIGTYTLTVIFNDGGEAGTTFNVERLTIEETQEVKGASKTTYVFLIIIFIIIGLIIGLMLRVYIKERRYEKNN